MNASVILFVWGAVVALIGASAYATSKSLISLIAGVVFGALILAGGALLRSGKDFGFWLGVVMTVALIGRFAPGFFKTGDWWPAGTMAVLGVLALVALFATRRA